MRGNSRNKSNRFRILVIDSVILVLSLAFMILSYLLFDNFIPKVLLILFFVAVFTVTVVRRIIIMLQGDAQEEDGRKNIDTQTLSLLNEYDEIVHTFSIANSVSAVIGRSTEENQVDIDLSNSSYAALVHPIHATLNYAGGNWYLEDVAGINDLKIQPRDGGDSIFLISPDRPCKVEQGDILFVANTRLLFQ